MQIDELFKQAISSMGAKGIEVEFEKAPEGKGDLTTNVAFKVAKQLGRNPYDVACEIVRFVNAH